jgi:hypothetical protein
VVGDTPGTYPVRGKCNIYRFNNINTTNNNEQTEREREREEGEERRRTKREWNSIDMGLV